MFHRIKIRTKIFWAIFLVVVISLIDVIYLIHYHSEKQTLNEYEQIAVDSWKDKAHAISLTFSHFKMMDAMIARSITRMNNWKEYLSNKREVFPEIRNILVFNANGEILYDVSSEKNRIPVSQNDLKKLFSTTSPQMSSIQPANMDHRISRIFVLSEVTTLKSANTPIRILLDLNIPYIFGSALSNRSEERRSSYYFVDREGTIVFTKESKKIGKNLVDLPDFQKFVGFSIMRNQNTTKPLETLDKIHKAFIFREPLEGGAFELIGVENLVPVLKAFQPSARFLGIFIVLNLLIMMLISELLASQFSKPLQTLVKSLSYYKEHNTLPSLKTVEKRNDEYGILAQDVLTYLEEIDKKNQQIQITLEQLKISEERYFQFLNHSPNMVFVVEGERLIFVNRTANRILGLKQNGGINHQKLPMFKTAQGKSYPLLHLPEYYHSFPIEGTLQLPNNELPILLYYSEFSYENTKHKLFILVDVTKIKQLEIKEKQMEWELMESNHLASIGILATGIAHNLNNPLTSIIGFTEMLRVKCPDEEEINSILRAANQMEKIIFMIMDRRKKEVDSKEIPIQLNEVIQDTLQLLDINTRFHYKLEKVVDLEPQLPTVLGRYGDFSLILDAFLYNAAEAMDKSPQKILKITSHSLKEGIQITISDTGTGIDSEDLDKIFLPFFTTKEPHGKREKMHNQNAGLGLFMAHKLLEKYRARIDVNSVKGKGTTFVMTIPRNGGEINE